MGNTNGTSNTASVPPRIKKVIIFGKTGSGKSSMANMIVKGTPNGPFRIGDGLRGVTDKCLTKTGRGYEVTDTVGLGEPLEGTVNDDRAKAILIKFLERVRGEYSHIIFVKEKGRLDNLDQALWESFTQIFKGAERAFMIVITKADKGKEWVNRQKASLQESYAAYEGKFVPVDFPSPPSSTDNVVDASLTEKRGESLENLENKLEKAFRRNKYEYFKPDYCCGTDDFQRTQKERIVDRMTNIARKFSIDFTTLVFKIIGVGTAAMDLVTAIINLEGDQVYL